MINLFNIAELGAAFVAGAIVIGVLQRLALHASYEINKVKAWRLRRTSWAEAAVPIELRRRHHRMGWLAELGIKPVKRANAKRSIDDLELQDIGIQPKPASAEEMPASVEDAAQARKSEPEEGVDVVSDGVQDVPEFASHGGQTGVEPSAVGAEANAEGVPARTGTGVAAEGSGTSQVEPAVRPEAAPAPVEGAETTRVRAAATGMGCPVTSATARGATFTAVTAKVTTARLETAGLAATEAAQITEMDWFAELRRLVDEPELQDSGWDKRYDLTTRFVGRVPMPVDLADPSAEEENPTEMLQVEAPDRPDWESGSDAYRPGFEVADQMAAKRVAIRRDLEVMRAHAAELLSTVEWPHFSRTTVLTAETVEAEPLVDGEIAESAETAEFAETAETAETAEAAETAESASLPSSDSGPDHPGGPSSPPPNPGAAAPPRRNADPRRADTQRTVKKKPRKVTAK